MSHNFINLDRRSDKPQNVYRYVYDWELVPSGHGPNVNYLLLHALVQWGENKDVPIDTFLIAIQYSSKIGKRIDVTQPPHFVEGDVKSVLDAFALFVQRRNGER